MKSAAQRNLASIVNPKTEKLNKLAFDPKTDTFFRLDGSIINRVTPSEIQQAFIDAGSDRRLYHNDGREV